MKLRTLALVIGVVSAGVLAPWSAVGGELEEPASECCNGKDNCKDKKNANNEPIPECCFVGQVCSTTESGTQGYCMKSCT
jgi:hypothetical protein